MLLALTEGVHKKGIFASNASYLQQQKYPARSAHCTLHLHFSHTARLSMFVLLLGAAASTVLFASDKASCAARFLWQHRRRCYKSYAAWCYTSYTAWYCCYSNCARTLACSSAQKSSELLRPGTAPQGGPCQGLRGHTQRWACPTCSQTPVKPSQT
jgi:hypothetical protein